MVESKLISHRGNLSGPNPEYENKPSYVEEALSLGYDVEIDVWVNKNSFYLGHDKATHLVSKVFLQNQSLWCHAKNGRALQKMLENDIHCFWHQNDTYTITSRGYIWTADIYAYLSERTIIMDAGQKKRSIFFPEKVGGFCSDWISNFKNNK